MQWGFLGSKMPCRYGSDRAAIGQVSITSRLKTARKSAVISVLPGTAVNAMVWKPVHASGPVLSLFSPALPRFIKCPESAKAVLCPGVETQYFWRWRGIVTASSACVTADAGLND